MCGARTRACRVETLSTLGRASPGVATRHAGVRAPHRHRQTSVRKTGIPNGYMIVAGGDELGRRTRVKFKSPTLNASFTITSGPVWPSVAFETDATGAHTWTWAIQWGWFEKSGTAQTR